MSLRVVWFVLTPRGTVAMDGRTVCHQIIVRNCFQLWLCRTRNLHENFIKSQSHFESHVRWKPIPFDFVVSVFFFFFISNSKILLEMVHLSGLPYGQMAGISALCCANEFEKKIEMRKLAVILAYLIANTISSTSTMHRGHFRIRGLCAVCGKRVYVKGLEICFIFITYYFIIMIRKETSTAMATFLFTILHVPCCPTNVCQCCAKCWDSRTMSTAHRNKKEIKQCSTHSTSACFFNKFKRKKNEKETSTKWNSKCTRGLWKKSKSANCRLKVRDRRLPVAENVWESEHNRCVRVTRDYQKNSFYAFD